jgi:hypothetical protein
MSSLGPGESYAVIAVFLRKWKPRDAGMSWPLIHAASPEDKKGDCIGDIDGPAHPAQRALAKSRTASAPPIRPLRNLPFLWRRGVPRSPEYSWGQVPPTSSTRSRRATLPAGALERIPARPTRMAIAPAFFRAVSALPAQTGCGAALRNTRPAKSCSSIENHHADLQPERWPRKAGAPVRRCAGH